MNIFGVFDGQLFAAEKEGPKEKETYIWRS